MELLNKVFSQAEFRLEVAFNEKWYSIKNLIHFRLSIETCPL